LKKNFLIIILLISLTSVYAGGNGGYAGAHLRMGLGAKSIALGNTGVAAPANAYSTFYNPAAVGNMEGRQVGLSYSFLSLDRHVSYLSFSMKVPPGAGFTLGWIESGVGDLYSYNSIGENTGEINHSANTIYFSFGRTFSENFSLGVSIKILFESINDGTDQFDYNSKGVGFDFGLQYKILPQLTLGYQLRDINSKLEANTEKIFERGGTTVDRFPVIHKIGLYYQAPLPWLRVYYDYERSNKSADKHHIGVEALQGENLALRAGLNDGILTFGAGMDFQFMGTRSFLDYAFLSSVVDEGSSHIFSWQIGF